MSQMKAYCVILAGGTGTRMGAGMPKQFLQLKGEPIIVHTMRRVMQCAGIEKVVVAVHPDWVEPFKEMMVKGGIDASRVLITLGGKERNDSIANALKAIHDYAKVGVEDIVIIHDAVRPFVSVAVLENSIKTAHEYGACVATMPAVDTMLDVDNGNVVAVPPRSRMFHGQAPDSARLLLLERALLSLTVEEQKIITGTAQILIVKGIPVKAIPGNAENIKITTPSDMIRAEQILEKESK